MATSRSQRIGIWIITVILGIGTLGSFLIMGLSLSNQKVDLAEQQKAYQQYLDQQKVAAQANADNSEALEGYSTRTFDASNVKTLKVEVLKTGNGDVIKKTDSINTSYFGWTSDGKIFDSSKKKNSADEPITFSLSGVISGWTEGLAGQKVGSVIRLTIPAAKAYGSTGSGVIEANTPLEFIVIIHKIDNSEA